MNKTIYFALLLALAAVACGRSSAPSETPQPVPTDPMVETLQVDCGIGDTCKELVIRGDEKYTLPDGGASPFSGYADPTIRQGDDGVLWLSYSWPHLKFVDRKPVPSVDIHLAKSEDKGNTWDFVSTLFTATPISNPVMPSQAGYLDYEVVNLLPATINGKETWFGVTLNYFVPEQGGMSMRPSDSFHIRVYQADSPADLANAPYAALAGGATAAAWNPSQWLIPDDMSAADKRTFFWNEPSLYYENGTLYLVMVAFNLKNREDISRDSVYVFAAKPNGQPSSWQWEYKGELVGNTEAIMLGATRLTQVDVVRGKQGDLLLIASPDDWNYDIGDYNHKGCVIMEIISLDKPAVKKDDAGNLLLRAKITDSQANELGSAACSYDPNSATGILFTRRNKTQSALTASIWQTFLQP
ncbi:MAG: hypothetical protein DCC56_09235 [Anaerolineae bacterium]|nr:MAG: hypothetical protein DCC56_09235 [Anaerolineae bacterium]WKZ45225.1 MAG: hypothetical protein QY302_05495 [Anaerolineales bacterium]